ncbi:methyl-accepting chemotaxis protein [Piscinibacter sakaiensis]|uniref:Twitching motility protein PilJ n=1 Tax=Piscinibacter sakaiensis TaxID=1547922 RepID=A0A0K8NWN5_PISS1|nr:methyl-accepting chemotaxis protein [Piscinibacter sakaiensis]GAP34783.1 twitching motility protein PilJ [Piscinibacter sakaiensis]
MSLPPDAPTDGRAAAPDLSHIDLGDREPDTIVLRRPAPPAEPRPASAAAPRPREEAAPRGADPASLLAAAPVPAAAAPVPAPHPAPGRGPDAAAVPAPPRPAGRARPRTAAPPPGPADAAAPTASAPLPFIGRLAAPVQQRVLAALVVLGLLGLIAMAVVTLRLNQQATGPAVLGSQALMHSQRLAKAAALAVEGSSRAFDELQQSAEELTRSLAALASGEAGAAPDAALRERLSAAQPLAQAADRQAGRLLGERARVLESREQVRSIDRISADLLESGEGLSALKLQQGAGAAELAAVGQLVMLTQRIPRTAHDLLRGHGGQRDVQILLLGKDLSVLRNLTQALGQGHPELRLPPPREGPQRERLQTLAAQVEALSGPVTGLLGHLQGLGAARAAAAAIEEGAEPLRGQLEGLTALLAAETTFSRAGIGLVLLAAFALTLGVLGLVRLHAAQQSERAAVAEAQRREAERLRAEAEAQQAQARLANEANQAAILRLMDELQAVSEGDLTRQATVSEDITGAIADSVNYTLEELRSLVAQVQSTATRVTDTTQQVEATSIDLLAASGEQLREIRDTGEAMLQMAGRINAVSAQAQETARVAEHSLGAAGQGLKAVQDTIGGMHALRNQIQETAKRIKRLGESSQEIGEITELISDITEQTNVLALNAAIQAASAGEAGRGFSVVAEEVQRLAERSADATRQIAALVRTIQGDTQDAVAAMERSTQGVVEGARLSDAAGAALADIDRVTRQLSGLIAGISEQALKEAGSANVVAEHIQHIFAVTEQTGDGTRSTAHIVRELSQTADELRRSVARFKIA